MSEQGRRQDSHLAWAAAEWHALHREGELDAGQQARFMAWLLASPEHLREYLMIGRLAGELGEALRAGPAQTGPATDIDAGNVVVLPLPRRHRAASAAGRPAAPQRRPPAATRRRWPKRVSAAAMLLVSIGVAGHLAWPRTTHYVAGHGEVRTITLPDGSVARLNAESALSARFGWMSRRVELERGQASFVVAEDRRPFSVHAAGLQVLDIGTTFDVSLLREQARIGVAEGRVRVLGDGGDGRLLADLGAGQVAGVDYRDHAVRISDEDAATLIAWWQRRIVFHDEPLRDVADRFNRLNRTRLHVDEEAGALRMTGNLRANDLASLRAFLEQQPTLAITLAGDGIHVRARPARAGGTATPANTALGGADGVAKRSPRSAPGAM